ncbi:MAG TPA: chromate transporter [Acidocella sp.]|jgi:chromate transporter|nr:MAG: chromate transporter [Acidocella sp. 20-58-15]HQT38978.1 chromate transporter [Acidocella sp.]
MPVVLITLFLTFLPISLISIGSGYAIIAEVQRQVVEVHHWVTQTEFTSVFAISRLAPGPGSLFVTLIGWKVAGFWGAVATSLGIFGPTTILTYFVARVWKRYTGARWLQIIQQGLRPVTTGMILASSYVLLASLSGGWPARIIAFIATALIMFTRVSPLLLLPAGACVFAAEQYMLN